MTSLERAREIVEIAVQTWRSECDGRLEDARLYDYISNAIAYELDAQRERWITELTQQRKITCEQYAAGLCAERTP